MLAKYYSPPQVFVHNFAISSIVESSLVTSRWNHDGRIMPSNHVQQNPGLHTTLKPAVRSVHTTCPGDQVPSCDLPIFVKKSSRRDQNVVPATCPANSNWFELKGLVAGACPMKFSLAPRVYCSCD